MYKDMDKYVPKLVWIDSRVEGVGSSWYYGGLDEMTLEELQMLLDKNNAVAVYDDVFYDNVQDIPFVPARHSVEVFGMPTGRHIPDNPTVTVVPKGTELEDTPGHSRRFKYPEGSMDRSGLVPERDWRKNLKTQFYDVTACDDTMIRRTVLSGVDLKTAWLHTKEIVHARPRRLFNPRIRKHREEKNNGI